MSIQACPECQQIHVTAKAAEVCLIAALNRSIFTSTPEVDWQVQFKAIDIWCAMRHYYTDLIRQVIHGPSLVDQAYAAIHGQGDNPNG